MPGGWSHPLGVVALPPPFAYDEGRPERGTHMDDSKNVPETDTRTGGRNLKNGVYPLRQGCTSVNADGFWRDQCRYWASPLRFGESDEEALDEGAQRQGPGAVGPAMPG